KENPKIAGFVDMKTLLALPVALKNLSDVKKALQMHIDFVVDNIKSDYHEYFNGKYEDKVNSFADLDPFLRNNKEVALAAIKRDPSNALFIGEELRQDILALKEIWRKCPESFLYAPEYYIKPPEVSPLIQYSPDIAEFVDTTTLFSLPQALRDSNGVVNALKMHTSFVAEKIKQGLYYNGYGLKTEVGNFQDLDPWLQNQMDVILAAVEKDPKNFAYIPEKFQNNIDVISKVDFKYFDVFSLLKDETILTIVKDLIENDKGSSVCKRKEDFINDPVFMRRACRLDIQNLRLVGGKLSASKDFLEPLVDLYPDSVSYVDPSALFVLSKRQKRFLNVKEIMQKYREDVIGKMFYDPAYFRTLPQAVRYDQILSEAAILARGDNFFYINPELQKKDKWILEALRRNADALGDCPSFLKEDKSFMLEAIEANKRVASAYVSDALAQDPDVSKAMETSWEESFPYTPELVKALSSLLEEGLMCLRDYFRKKLLP
ncbi:MAG: DUF4116 domain-containing protein, partial [Verrucomicrobia bacterium]|nr:DUF4116 domain-containing protein [Verrucomicrobiota bacterium]